MGEEDVGGVNYSPCLPLHKRAALVPTAKKKICKFSNNFLAVSGHVMKSGGRVFLFNGRIFFSCGRNLL